jgi:hypothetical protein
VRQAGAVASREERGRLVAKLDACSVPDAKDATMEWQEVAVSHQSRDR